MRGQSRLASLLEQCSSVATGFCVSLLLWTLVVVPVWGLPVTAGDNLAITGLFTLASIARGYIFRRVFNALMIWRQQ